MNNPVITNSKTEIIPFDGRGLQFELLPSGEMHRGDASLILPSCNTKEGIESMLTSLAGLNALLEERHFAGYSLNQSLETFIILGRWHLDGCGNVGSIYFQHRNTLIAPKDISESIADVIPGKEFFDHLDRLRTEDRHLEITIRSPVVIPLAHIGCSGCSREWARDDWAQVKKLTEENALPLNDLAGKTFAEFKEMLAQRTDAYCYVQPDLPLRNDRFIDLIPRSDSPQYPNNKDGWLRELPGGDAYVIQPGDESLILERRYYHRECFQALPKDQPRRPKS